MKPLFVFIATLPILASSAFSEVWPSENLLENPGLEGKDSDRAPHWSFEGTGEILAENGKGSNGTRAVKLSTGEGAFGLQADKIVLPNATVEVSFEIKAKLEGSSPVYTAINWYADKSLVGTNQGKPLDGDADWCTLTVSAQPPEKATSFACVVHADNHKGVAYLDDACARTYTTKAPDLNIICNQVGYDGTRPIQILVQAPDFISGEGSFQVVNDKNEVIQNGELIPAGTVPEWEKNYYLAKIDQLPEGNNYRLKAILSGLSGTSYPFSVKPDIIPQKTLGPAASFYFYQRCGFEVPGWHAACHLDDARMPDGTHRDCTGGWHDAGDYNKYNDHGFAALSVYALAYAYERYGDWMTEYAKSVKLPTALEEAQWGADWLLKMQDEASGRLWRNVYAGRVETAVYWGPPEKETDNIPGTEDDRPLIGDPVDRNSGNPEAIAAWALVGRLSNEKKYVDAAVLCYKALQETDIKHVHSKSFALIACLELERLFPEEEYGARAEALASEVIACQVRSGVYKGGYAGAPNEEIPYIGATTCGLPAVALSLYGLAHGDTLGIRDSLMEYLNFSRYLADNPLHISKLIQNGKKVFFLSAPEGAHFVGQNTMYLMQAWALACASKFTQDDSFRELALHQIDWVLGRNPLSICMLEGQGSFNPLRYHHRYNSIPGHPRGAVPGTVCNGLIKPQPGPDKPTFDMRMNMIRPSFESNEPWIPHNATYLLAVSSL